MATFRRKSQLSKTLPEVLMDDTVLPYFMEYMQKQNAENLLNFWLTAETFRLSTINRLKTNSISRLKTSKVDSTCTSQNDHKDMFSDSDATSSSDACSFSGHAEKEDTEGHNLKSDNSDHDFRELTGYEATATDSVAASTDLTNPSSTALFCPKYDPSLKETLCDNCGYIVADKELDNRILNDSLRGARPKESSSSTGVTQNGINQDNVMNQSMARNTPGSLKGCRPSKVTFELKPDFEHEQREFCQRRTRSIVIDAVSIYSKYISLEATHPIGLEESMRQQIESKWNDRSKARVSN